MNPTIDMKQPLPKLGVLALMLEAYEPIFPGIIARQTAYVREVLADLAGTIGYEILTSLGRRYARHYCGGNP